MFARNQSRSVASSLLAVVVLLAFVVVPGASARQDTRDAVATTTAVTRTSAATFAEWHYYNVSIDANVPAGSYVMLYRGSSAPTGPFAWSSPCVSGYCLSYSQSPPNVTTSFREGYELMKLVRRGRMVPRAQQCFDVPAWETCYARYQTPYEYSLPQPPLDQGDGNCGHGRHGDSASECINDPVNTASGAFLNHTTDLQLPGLGVPFRFVRSYTSRDTAVGRLGIGWTDSLGAGLTIAGNGDVTLRGEDGQKLVYTHQADGSYRGAAGARSTLRAVAGGYELTRLDQVVYAFDSSGRLTSMRDRNGHGLAFSYDGSGRLTSVTDAAGRVHQLSYNAAGLLASVQLSDGRSVSYGYTDGRLTSVTDVRGGTTSYRYDASGRLDQITDANGHLEVRNTYDADGRVVEQLDALGNRTTFAWDVFTQTATVTDARGKVWKDVYSGNVLQKRIDPAGKTTVYTFDSNLNLTGLTDGRGNKTTMTYDARGNLLTRTAPAPLSYQESFTYNATNDLLTRKDGRNITTTLVYDTAGNLTSVSRAGTTLAQLTRDPSTKLVTASTDARGKTTTFGYDGSGNLTSVTTPLGKKTTIEYDSSGRPTGVVDPRGNESGANPADYRTSYGWNAGDLRTSITDPLGNATSFAYDAIGNVTSITDAKARTTAYTYDAANHLLTVTAPGGAVTSYAYDAIGDMTRKTDPNAHVTNYTYDDVGRLATVSDPLTRTWSYTYDANSNLTRLDVPGGGSISRAYDVINRLTAIDYSDTTPDVQFGYDANSNRTSMTDGLGSVSYTYDNWDRQLTVTRGTDTFSYVYDAAGNVTQRTYPGSLVSTYTYDDDGRMASVTGASGTTTFAYDAAAELVQKTLPAANGYIETRTYDRVGRTTEVRHAKDGTPLSYFQYAYDATNNPTSVTSQDGTTTYAYDVRDRLTEACFNADCSSYVRYTYDAVGNRLTETRPEVTSTYTYDAADELTSQGGLNYSYDSRGNQTQAGTRTFAWTLANRLASTTDGGTTTTYSYDGDGERLQATTAGQTMNFRWDDNFAVPQLAIERDGGGAPVRSYTYGDGPIAMLSGGQTSYFHRDMLGSVANVTSQSGGLQWSYSYEPYGLARATTKNDPAAPDNSMRFAGEYLDGTSLYHLRARQLDPATGRFLGIDPLQRSATEPANSPYSYADARPSVFVDPLGLGPITPKPLPYVLAAVGGSGPTAPRPGPDPSNPRPLGYCPTDTTLACSSIGANTCGSVWCYIKHKGPRVAVGGVLIVGGAALTAFGIVEIGGCAGAGAETGGFIYIVAGAVCVQSALAHMGAGVGAMGLGYYIMRG